MAVSASIHGHAHAVHEDSHDKHGHDAHEHHGEVPYAIAWRRNRLGLWLFFLSELFLFGGMLSARFYLWQENGVTTRPGLSQTIGFIVTTVLLISSISMAMGESAIEHGDRKTFLVCLIITAVLGTAFLLGVMVFEWGLFPSIYPAEHRPWDDQYSAIIFLMTGMHAIHVLSGVIFILIVWNLGRRGHFSAERHWGVEACAIYWHFVDLVWIFFYPALYLIGTVVHHG